MQTHMAPQPMALRSVLRKSALNHCCQSCFFCSGRVMAAVSGMPASRGRSRVLARPPHSPTRLEYTAMSGRKAMPRNTGRGIWNT